MSNEYFKCLDIRFLYGKIQNVESRKISRIGRE
jgi:hypothetical protein